MKKALFLSLVIFVIMAGVAIAETLHPDGIGGYNSSRGHYSPDGIGGLNGPDGHYSPDGIGGFNGPSGYFFPDGTGGVSGPDNEKDSSSPRKQITKTPLSREQLINKAWKKSNAYSKFKMGTMSKTEGESSEDYNKWVKEKEEKAKRRWIERCKRGIERDCWSEPVVATKSKNTDENEHKQDEAREQNVSWVDNKNNKSLKPVNPGPIHKEKKNGVWKFSN